jgi:uncharacterized membrane protein YphA (DoxX/SURF4 family)
MSDNTSRAAGIFFTRAFLGVIFLMQGYGKLFIYTVPRVYQMFFKVFEATFLPVWLIRSAAWYTSVVEFVCGFLLIIGLFRQCALYLLAIDLFIVSFGHGLMEPIWDLQHVIPRAILVITLLLVPRQWDQWHIDRLIKKEEKSNI